MLMSNATQNLTTCAQVDIYGYQRVEWMMTYFGTCARSPMEQASFWIGLLSIGFWLCANTPQLVENYRKKDASSLSPTLLGLWVSGDGTNLLGALLTGQLFTQIALAVYFFIMDILMITQYIYYYIRNRRLKKKEEDEVSLVTDSGAAETDSLLNPGSTNTSPMYSFMILGIFACLFLFSLNLQSSGQTSYTTGRRLLQDEPPAGEVDPWPPTSFEDITGYTIGCISAALYLGSRIPQILKNFFRRSTEGLSVILFFCAFMGNLTYTLSIFLYSVRYKFILAKLPWIIGSAGVLFMDMTILLQFMMFRNNIEKFTEANKLN